MRVIIPIRGSDNEEFHKKYDSFLKEIVKYNDDVNLIRLLDNYEDEYKHIESISFKIIISSEYFKNVNEEIKELQEQYPNFKTDFISEYLDIQIKLKNQEHEEIFGKFSIELILNKLSLLIHLSYTTKIDFLYGLIFSSKKKYLGETEIILSSLDFAYEHALKVKWPTIKNITLKTTIDWFTKNNLHTDYNSKNKLHRAVNAFSYLFSKLHEKDSSNLFWVMVGIEALLAEGSSNILNQIKTKSSLILGHPVEYKKKLDKLYDYRSRLVHGDFDFPAKFSSDYDTFEEEYWDYLSFATSILIALIRELIRTGKNEFLFEYKRKK